MKSMLTGGAVLCTIIWYACDAKLNQIVSRKASDKPIKSINLPVEKLAFHADSGGIFKLKSGTVIQFPKSAFVDKNGNKITDVVKIEFEEYHKTSEIFLSGINMMYEQNGEAQPFESAGMFKIDGTCKNQSIEIAEGKNLRIDLASLKKEDNYDFFVMNDENGQWERINSTSVNKDTTSFLVNSRTSKEATNQEIENKIPEVANPDATVLDLDLDYSRYPQLKEFYGVAWQIENKKNDQTEWLKEDWDNIKLVSTGSGINDFRLDFRKLNTITSVKVKPVLSEEARSKIEKAYQLEEENQRKLLPLLANILNQNINESKFIRSLTINGFGIYNCDRVIQMENPVALDAVFQVDGQDIRNGKFYLLSNNNSSITQYYNKFKFDNNRNNRLVFILSDNKIGFVDAETIRTIGMSAIKSEEKEFKVNIEVQPIDISFDSPDELIQLLDKI